MQMISKKTWLQNVLRVICLRFIFFCAYVALGSIGKAAKGFAFPVNGIIMGGMDWKIAMWSMCFANAACWSTLKLLSLSVASKIISVQGLWIAWAAYYLVQGLVGTMRLASHTGPWEFLAPTTRKQQQEKQSSQADSVGASVSKPPPS